MKPGIRWGSHKFGEFSFQILYVQGGRREPSYKEDKEEKMFYSHTFLARKGPLSTVWIAAHLQHRLKKSHYTSTDILSTIRKSLPFALKKEKRH
ncbi:hypothetical protein RIF29_20845 [Crotalaria pallida]|uniref:Rad21/Rec8-like protein N-terminal domain-containing protein n=1 Tax=Crotalaria pallida TaxID=3830 RepID=A0AAN9FAF8_CROPI